jgi:hypothetical protein
MKQFTLMFTMLLTIAANLISCASAPTPTTIPSPTPKLAPTATPIATATTQPATFSDPFAYCQSIGTIDSPDARYTGEKIPVSIAKGLQKAMGLAPDAPLDFLVRSSFWRCMDGKVYGCSVGANIPCQGKADTSKTPNQGMTDWCKQNPNDQGIPAAAAGRETVYTWKCVSGTPQVDKQMLNPDARGFITEFWYALSAN